MIEISAPWSASGRIAGLSRHSVLEHRPRPIGHERKPVPLAEAQLLLGTKVAPAIW